MDLPELVVFMVDSQPRCDECGGTILLGECLRQEGTRALCMECADLGHLVFLQRGNVALTRRSTRYSELVAVVMRWSKRRKQYERQGILVENAALERAEEECEADSAARAQRQERAKVRRDELDQVYVRDFESQILSLFPACPAETATAIAEHACRKYSGRVGRSAAAKRFDSDAIVLAVRAHVRHAHTNYDELLMSGWARHEAREEIAEDIEKVVDRWRGL